MSGQWKWSLQVVSINGQWEWPQETKLTIGPRDAMMAGSSNNCLALHIVHTMCHRTVGILIGFHSSLDQMTTRHFGLQIIRVQNNLT